MSSRVYPLFQRGNPQTRVFLPNFNVFCVRPSIKQPSNVVTFHCSMKMTKFDIHTYLTKIYKLPIADIKMEIDMGELKKAIPGGYIIKDEDVKVAYVTLGDNQRFEFPNLFPVDKIDQEHKPNKEMDLLMKEYKKKTGKDEEQRPGLPSWFGL